MIKTMREFILYGLDKRTETIDEIKTFFDLSAYEFDIKIILTEGLNNAFVHGNKGDKYKPILLRCEKSCGVVTFEIQDTGDGLENVVLPDQILDENLLDEGGRGLYLIKCFSDGVIFEKNTLTITKRVA